MFDACTVGDTAHIDTILKFLPHARQHVDTCVLATHMSTCWCVWGKNLNSVSMCAVSPAVHASNASRCQKKTFSVFLWLWTIPLRYLLWCSCYKCL